MKKIEQEYREASDSVYDFYMEHIKITSNRWDFETTSKLFDKYTSFCSSSGVYAVGKQKFSRRLSAIMKELCRNNCSISGKIAAFEYVSAPIRGYRGIQYNQMVN